jgi:hypothetical protein
MLKWLLGMIDGPIISRTCAAVATGAFNFLTIYMHWQVDPQFQASLQATLSFIVYAAVHAGIVTGSAAAGNAVTSSTAANAHGAQS